jgi:flagellar motor switch protein FliM
MDQDKSLTQKEIDALLSILPAGGSSAPPIPGLDAGFVGSTRAYDFRSPDKFSKEQIRTLQMIHENFSRRVSSSLAAYLRATIQMACVHIEQGSFVDFMQNIPTNSLVGVLKMDPLPGRALLTFDPATATVMVDRLLGGFGQPLKDDEHEITDIEQALLRGIVQYLAGGLEEAWRNVIALTVSLEETTLNPEFVQVALPTDAAIFLGFEIKIRESNGMMSICLPYSLLKPIVSDLSPHTWVAGETKEAGAYRTGLFAHLKHTRVDFSVLLGEIAVNFEELLHLQGGDVLLLDTVVSRPLPVMVGQTKRYMGQPGRSGKYLAVQITSVVQEPANESDMVIDG